MATKLTFPPLSYIGWGEAAKLVDEANRRGATRVFVVTDKILRGIGVVDRVLNPLRKRGIAISIFDDIVPEPPVGLGQDIVEAVRSEPYDMVVGIGGGSAMDLAKLAAVLADNPGEVRDYLNLTGTRTPIKRGLPKVLLPTTAGTGSEVTNISVLSLDTSKDVVTHDYLIAEAAIVDPELTVTVPPRITAATGVDALTHAIEAYVSVLASDATDALALRAIRLIGSSLRMAVADGSDRNARTSMATGSYLAGLAFFNAGVAGVHALAYPIGGRFHIAHGESNAVMLPYVMRYIRASCENRMADVLAAFRGDPASGDSAHAASYACVEELERLIRDVHIPTTLKGFGIPADALDTLTEDGVRQKRLLARSPLTLAYDDIRTIYEAAFTGAAIEPAPRPE